MFLLMCTHCAQCSSVECKNIKYNNWIVKPLLTGWLIVLVANNKCLQQAILNLISFCEISNVKCEITIFYASIWSEYNGTASWNI